MRSGCSSLHILSWNLGLWPLISESKVSLKSCGVLKRIWKDQSQEKGSRWNRGEGRLGDSHMRESKSNWERTSSPPPMLLNHALTPQSRGAKECKPVVKTHPEVLANEAQKHKGSLSSANTEWAAATCSKALPQAPEGQRRMRCTLPWCGAQSRVSVHSLRTPPPVRKLTNYGRRRRNSFDSLVQFSKNKGNYYDLIENKTWGGEGWD